MSTFAPFAPLLDFQGPPQAFWNAWTGVGLDLLEGELAVLYVRSPAPEVGAGWTVFAVAPEAVAEQAAALPPLSAMVGDDLIARAVKEGVGGVGVASGPVPQGGWAAGLVYLRPEGADRELLLCLHYPRRLQGEAVERTLVALGMVPRCYSLGRDNRRVARDAQRFREMLDLLGRVLDAESFNQAALALVNELADLFGCELVTLSWKAREGLRLRAVSHNETLEHRSELTDLLEEAGQEALSQQQEIAWPSQGKAVTWAHRSYAEARRPGHMFTLPLVLGEDALGALVCERQALKFSRAEQWALRMLCDQVTRPLRVLERHQRPLLSRLGQEIQASLPRQLKPTTWEGRSLAWGLGIAAVAVVLIPFPYWIDTSAVIKTDAMAYVGAPFDGYIQSSSVTLGATVTAGVTMVNLATHELLMERAADLADMAQFGREVEKRRAAGQLAEMRIAEAQMAQTQAKLDQVEYRIAHAAVVAPISGVVVEGEPGKNLGGAIKRGDNLLKIAAVNNLYAELSVDEKDIKLISPEQSASITLVADPEQSWPLKVRRVIPVPAVKDGANRFPVHADPLSANLSWWRPGMSGVVKVFVGFRSLWWIATHRLLDAIRLYLWI